ARLVIFADGSIKCLFQVCNAALSISEADSAQSINCAAKANPGHLLAAATFFRHALFAKVIDFLEASFTCAHICAHLPGPTLRSQILVMLINHQKMVDA